MNESHLHAIVTAAINAGLPAVYELPSQRAAHAWRHAFYRLRRKEGNSSILHAVQLSWGADRQSFILEASAAGNLSNAAGPIEVVVSDGAPRGSTGQVSGEAPPAYIEGLAETLGIKL